MNGMIYCRLTSDNKKLLDYQESVLKKMLKEKNIGPDLVVKEIRSEHDISYEFNDVVYRINHNKIDFLAIYDDSRITSNKENYQEFEMMCEMNNVKILKYKE